MSNEQNGKSFTASLVGGGLAGTSVDVALFPLDTLKTRMQAAEGFMKAGGFRGIYSGISAAAAGSAPGAALFFSTYESSKSILFKLPFMEERPSYVHMAAASIGEMAGCLVRCPTEIVKQRMQAGMVDSAVKAVKTIHSADGIRGLYRGYWTMIAREIPFSLIQFPLWEKLKTTWSTKQNAPVSSVQGAICGSIAGSIAAFTTTPVDVIKTRLMLGKDAQGKAYKGALDAFQRICNEEGGKKLFSGAGPRTMWIGIGGFVFFGVYEKVTAMLDRSD